MLGFVVNNLFYEFYLLGRLSTLSCEKLCCATAPCYLSLRKTCLEGTPADVCITQSLNLFWEEVRQAYCLSPPVLFCWDESKGQIHNLLHHHTSMTARTYLGNVSRVINIRYHRNNRLYRTAISRLKVNSLKLKDFDLIHTLNSNPVFFIYFLFLKGFRMVCLLYCSPSAGVVN